MNEHLVTIGAELTSAIAAPARRTISLDTAARKALFGLLDPGARSRLGTTPVRCDAFFLDAHQGGGTSPFAWSPRTARRQLGLAAVRSCVWGLTTNPTDGVTLEIERLLRRVADGMERSGSLAWYLHDADGPLRAATIATAVTYASELWCTLEWRSLSVRPVVGAPDDRVCHPAGGLILQSRAEIRLAVPVRSELGTTGSSEARLVILSGQPRREARLILAGAALGAALASRHGDVATTMVAAFPDTGRALVMEVDETTLERAANAISKRVVALRSEPIIPLVSSAA